MDARRQLVVLPELATSGYHLTPAEACAAALSADSSVFEAWARLLHPDAVLVVGFAEAADGAVYNSAAALTRQGMLAVYRKTHLWDSEKDVFTAGDVAGGVLQTPAGPLGSPLCYDLEFPECHEDSPSWVLRSWP
jgi:predicted amidohydrolase